MFSHPSFLFAFSQDHVVAALVAGLGFGVTTVEGVGLTSALTFGVAMAGVSDTTGTFALAVGVAVFLPQPAKARTAAKVMATAQLHFFILNTSRILLFGFRCTKSSIAGMFSFYYEIATVF